MKFYTVDELKTIPEDILGSLTAINDAIITEGASPLPLCSRSLMTISTRSFRL